MLLDGDWRLKLVVVLCVERRERMVGVGRHLYISRRIRWHDLLAVMQLEAVGD